MSSTYVDTPTFAVIVAPTGCKPVYMKLFPGSPEAFSTLHEVEAVVFRPETIYELNCEGARSRRKFPSNRHQLAALVEEVGEVAKALLEGEGRERVRAEAIQVANVALRLYEEGDADYAPVAK